MSVSPITEHAPTPAPMGVDAPTDAPTGVRYSVLAWACSLSMLTYVDRVVISKVQEPMSADLGLDATDMGWALFAFFVAYSIFEVPTGWLGDRLGPRRVLFRIVVWWSVFTVLTGLVFRFEFNVAGIALGSFALLLAVRFLFGIGEAGAYPNSAKLLRNWFPYRQRGFAQGMLWAFARFGGAATPMLILATIGWLGWRGVFLSFGLVGAVWAFFFRRCLRDVPVEDPRVNDAERRWIGLDIALGPHSVVAHSVVARSPTVSRDGPKVSPTERTLHGSTDDLPDRGGARETFGRDGDTVGDRATTGIGQDIALGPRAPISWRTMLTSRTLWLLAAMYFFGNLGGCFYITWDQKYYTEVLDLSGFGLTMATTLPLFCGGIACLLGGFSTDALVRVLGRRWGRTLQGMLAYLLGAGFFLAALVVRHPALSVILLCAASFSKDLAMSVSWAACLDVGHRYSGSVSGFMNMVGNLGAAVASPLVAYLALGEGVGGWNAPLVVATGSLTLAGLTWLLVDPTRTIVYAPADRLRLAAAGELRP